MSLDSRDKRASAIGVGLPWPGALPLPDGTLTAGDRCQVGYTYRIFDLVGAAIYVRQATDVMSVFDAALAARSRTVIRIETVSLHDSQLRFIVVPGITIILRQVTDTIGLADALQIQRVIERHASDAVLVLDVVDWARFYTQLVTDGVALTELFATWRERQQAGSDSVVVDDTAAVQRTRIRQSTETVSVLDSVLRFYYPVVVNYLPLSGVRPGMVGSKRGVLKRHVLGDQVQAHRLTATGMVRFRPQVAMRVFAKRPSLTGAEQP